MPNTKPTPAKPGTYTASTRTVKKARKSRPPLLVKRANVEDEATGQAFELYEFRKPLGRTGSARFQRDRAWDGEKLKNDLVSRNWVVSREKAQDIASSASRKRPREYWIHAAHVGWRPGRKGFVLHHEVVGAPGNRPLVKPPLWLTGRQAVTLSRKGDLPAWIEKVAKPCRFSTRLMLMVSASFAAPLLHIMGRQPFAIMLFGRSKTGKTAGHLAAGSVVSSGVESQLPNFNVTDAAFQETAHNFALMYAGGRLAIDAGLLPWKPQRLCSAVVTCFRAAMQALDAQEDLEAESRRNPPGAA